MNRSVRPLKIAARLELTTLAMLLLNLVLGNTLLAGAIIGPVHVGLYLFVIIATARDPRTMPGTTALAFVPGIGGLLVRRRLRVTPASLDLGGV